MAIPLLNPPRFKATRDRRIDSRSVECPTCLAKPRDPCVTFAGLVSQSCHPSRRRMAVRADNLARGI